MNAITQEQATFKAEEKDLVETIDSLERAIGTIEKEMKSGASMMQLKEAALPAPTMKAMTAISTSTRHECYEGHEVKVLRCEKISGVALKAFSEGR